MLGCLYEWTRGCSFLCRILCEIALEMASFCEFEEYEEDEFVNIFLTQKSDMDKVISLEEKSVLEPLKDPNYSDISDFEDEGLERQLR